MADGKGTLGQSLFWEKQAVSSLFSYTDQVLWYESSRARRYMKEVYYVANQLEKKNTPVEREVSKHEQFHHFI